MMASRRGAILQLADNSAATLIESLTQERFRARERYEWINQVCRRLVCRKTPYLPTAKLVAEEGAIAIPGFPSEQTIYNAYADMLKIWRDAYSALININNDVTSYDLDNLDLASTDIGTRFALQEMKRHLLEAHQRNNMLKQLITDSVPVVADMMPAQSGSVIEKLDHWVTQMRQGLFSIDEAGLKVSRKTPVGTMIMDIQLFEDISVLISDFESTKRRKNAIVEL